MNTKKRHAASYFITFTDNFTHYSHVYLISHKLEALGCFRRFMNLVENQTKKTIKTLIIDRGREYLFDNFKKLCDKNGIQRQLMIAYT